MKRYVVLMCVAILVFAISAANAQMYWNLARGGASIAAPTFSTAWSANPAVLAGLPAARDMGEMATLMPDQALWHNEASADVEINGDTDLWAVNWGGYNSGSGWGFGGGFLDEDGWQEYGVGAASTIYGFSVGANIVHGEPDIGDSSDMFSVGVYKYLDQSQSVDSPIAGIHLGAVYDDVTDEIDGMLNLGVAVDFVQGWTLAVDLIDFDTVNAGVSTCLGQAKEWEVAAGLNDGDLTLGATYDVTKNAEGGNWKIGVGWADFDWDDVMYGGAVYVW